VLHWTLRQWWSSPGRAFLMTAVFAAVIGLSLAFEGIRAGVLGDLHDFSASLPADLVALERGTARFLFVNSHLAQLSRAQAEAAIPGLEAHPIVLVPFILREHGEQSPAMLIGFDTLGGPQKLAEGRAPTAAPEVVIDANLARLQDLKLGDSIKIFDASLEIVGLSEGTTSPFMPYAFVTYDRLLDVLLDSDLSFGTDDTSLVSALLIELPPSLDVAAAKQQLAQALPDMSLFTTDELGTADRTFGAHLLGSILFLVSAITWLIALLTMAMLRFSDVNAHLHEYGIQKALGAGPAALALSLTAGGLLTALCALPLALVFAQGLAEITRAWNPLYVPRIWETGVLAKGIAVAIGASVVGGLIPLPRLMRLEPTVVFQR